MVQVSLLLELELVLFICLCFWVLPVLLLHTNILPPSLRCLLVQFCHLDLNRIHWWKKIRPLRQGYMLCHVTFTHIDGLIGGFHESIDLLFSHGRLFLIVFIPIPPKEPLSCQSCSVDATNIVIGEHFFESINLIVNIQVESTTKHNSWTICLF